MIFIRALTEKEKKSPAALRKGMCSLVGTKVGYEVVYKPYGPDGLREGRGFYYSEGEKV